MEDLLVGSEEAAGGRTVKKSLPNKMSDLLEVAVDDAQKCNADPKYVLNMSRWHTPAYGVCHVCLAGSVIAKTLEGKPSEEYDIDLDFEGKLPDKLDAIDSMRCACFMQAAYTLKIKLTTLQAGTIAKLQDSLRLRVSKMKDGRYSWGTYKWVIKKLREVGL